MAIFDRKTTLASYDAFYFDNSMFEEHVKAHVACQTSLNNYFGARVAEQRWRTDGKFPTE